MSYKESGNQGKKFCFKKFIRKIRFNIIDEKNGENMSDGGFENKVNFNDTSSAWDPLGMYTGVPREKYEKPIQDADDL